MLHTSLFLVTSYFIALIQRHNRAMLAAAFQPAASAIFVPPAKEAGGFYSCPFFSILSTPHYFAACFISSLQQITMQSFWICDQCRNVYFLLK